MLFLLIRVHSSPAGPTKIRMSKKTLDNLAPFAHKTSFLDERGLERSFVPHFLILKKLKRLTTYTPNFKATEPALEGEAAERVSIANFLFPQQLQPLVLIV